MKAYSFRKRDKRETYFFLISRNNPTLVVFFTLSLFAPRLMLIPVVT